MLKELQPEFVSVCPRHADQQCAMALAAVEAGVKGIYVEKPFCRTPAEADRLLEASAERGARIAVAHRNAWHPVMTVIGRMIEDGELGKLLEIRGRGKGDRRGGSEDLWVLGSHVMNLLHRFGGDPVSCSAIMLQDGRRVVKEDVAEGPEGLGPLAGNEVHARYEMSKGVIATFDSIANDGTENAGFGVQLIGSKGIVSIQADRDPVAHFVPGNPFQPTREARPWIPITTAGVGVAEADPALVREVEEHVVAIRDLIAACDEGRAPRCDAGAGAATVEMICAVFESHRQGARAVGFPLEERENALLRL
jgi:predicted dehydrogenase